MRSSVDNPFSPGSDTVPDVWAGRAVQLQDWRDVVRPRRTAGIAERGRTIIGEAGLGKSTLARRIASEAERRGDWVTPQIRIPLGSDPLKAVALAVLDLADRAGLGAGRSRRMKDVLGRVRSVAASGISLTIDRAPGPEPHTALTALLVEIGIEAIRQGVAVLVHIDEVQNITNKGVLSQLLISLGDALTHQHPVSAPGNATIEHALPLAVYLTGLPDFIETAEAQKGATFARRFATTTLSPISNEDLEAALRPFVTSGWKVPDDRGGSQRVTLTPDAAAKIIELCCGEPFLFQLAGARAWYADSSNLITAEHVRSGWEQAQSEAAAHVERIHARLPGRERELIDAMAALDPTDRTANRIAQAMGLDNATQIGTAAARLDTIRGIIDRGRPYTFRHRAIEAYLTSDWPRV